MNENDLAKKIVRHLDQGTSNLDARVQYRLQAARQQALDACAKPRHSFHLAWDGHHIGHNGIHAPFRAWIPLAALIAGLLFITYWQASPQTTDVFEVDAYLLAQDLPIHAFIDTGFDTWLAGSSEE